MKRQQLTDAQVEELVKKHGHVKVNLPSTIQTFQQGNGEGIWAVPYDDEAAHLYDEGAPEGQARFVACNNSIYYPEITFGSVVLCNFRGDKRPIAVWDDLPRTKEAEGHRKKVLDRIFNPESDPHEPV